eukprot:5024947-Amphidinium_carterae.1
MPTRLFLEKNFLRTFTAGVRTTSCVKGFVEPSNQSITITLTDIRASQGAIRENWIQASKKEIDIPFSPERDALKLKCKKIGWQYSELPCKGVFTIKPNKYKARICGCGNFEQDTYGITATNEMDTCIM